MPVDLSDAPASLWDDPADDAPNNEGTPTGGGRTTPRPGVAPELGIPGRTPAPGVTGKFLGFEMEIACKAIPEKQWNFQFPIDQRCNAPR